MAKKHSDCSCPSDGSYFCVRCLQLAARAGLTLLPPAPSPLRPDDAEEPEGAFMERLRKLAVDMGYLYWHQYSAKKSTPGMVDCIMVKPVECLAPGEPSTLHMLELKTETGQLTPAQRRWIEALQRVTQVNARMLRPSDWPEMVEKLRNR